jgi:aminoglycoside phosphotransferase (APT) family kinase protein
VEDFGLTPLAGGHSGETFLAAAAGERSVVRLYARRGARRGPRAAEVDAAVLGLVRGLLPVPDVLEVRRADPDADTPGLLVTTFLPGERLDRLLPVLDEAERQAVGGRLGRILGRLAGMPMLRAGELLDPELRIGPMPEEARDLPSWVAAHRTGTALWAWAGRRMDGLAAVADRAQELLDTVTRACLVHGDFNPKNLLVDPESGVVTGLVDWEFAHAGLPVSDLGNLLRFERGPAFADAVLDAYAETVPDAGDDVLDLARAADLFALVELAGRKGENPVTERAEELLGAIADSGDLHAVP